MFRFATILPACAALLASSGDGARFSALHAGPKAKFTAPSVLSHADNLRLVDTPRSPPRKVFRQADDGLFYVDAQVNGRSVRFVIDTGSSVVVLTRADALRVGVEPGPTASVKLETAGGSSNMRWATLDRILLAGQRVTKVDAAIVDSDLPVSLMGQSMLSRLDSVQMAQGVLRLN